MSKKLFIPGPIDVSEDVLEKMATPVISHRSKEASELQKSITEKAKKYLAHEGYEPLYGARPLKRIIRQLVEIPLSMNILEGDFVKGDKVLVDYNDKELTFLKN